MKKNENIDKILAKNIKYYREKRNMTLEELSKLTNINKNYLARIENCTTKRLKISKIFAIAQALQITVSKLFS